MADGHGGHGHHGHQHGLGHVHVTGASLKLAFYLNLAIVGIQLLGALGSHSLALLSDAGHNAADVFAIGLAWYAHVQAARPPSARMTYGYHRAGILVALANAVSLIAMAGVLCYEAYGRILQPQPVVPAPLFVAAALGLVFNAYAALALRGDADVNIRGAFLHLLGDAVASAGVLAGGVVMLYTGWYWLDPLLSVGISVLIALGAWGVIQRTIRILMEGIPEHVDPGAVVAAIGRVAGVVSVHDVHIWSLAVGRVALSCHVVVDGERTVGDARPLLAELNDLLTDRFGIGHTTIQLECTEHGHAVDGCGAPSSAHTDLADQRI